MPDTTMPPPATISQAQLRTVLAGAMLTMMLGALDANIVNTALPRIVGDLGGLRHLSWVVTGFMLASTVTTPIYGKLSDTYGRRTVFVIAIVVFLAGSLLCGVAQSMGQLIGYRTLQGIGAGGLMVLGQASLGDVVAPRDRPRYQGLFIGTFAFSSVAGPLLGGLITQALSWRWVFYVNLPIGALALVMICVGLRNKGTGRVGAIDLAGAGLLAGLTTSLLLLLAWGGNLFDWFSWPTAGLLVAVMVLLWGFVARERTASDPIMRLPMFNNPVFSRAVTAGGMMMFAMLGSTVFLPLYFQLVLGMSPALAGAMLLPQVIGMLITSTIGGRIISRMGRARPVVLAGLCLETGALASLAALSVLAAPAWAFLFSMAALGFGMGMSMPNVTTVVQNAVPQREMGAATGTMTFLRSLGGALGVAASGSIMASRLAAALGRAGGHVDLSALTEHGARALAGMTQMQQAAVSGAYRSALTGCFALSTVVMMAALLLVLGLPDIQLRGTLDDAGAAARPAR